MELDSMEQHIRSRYELTTRHYEFAGRRFSVLQLEDFERAVDRLIDQLSAEGRNDIVPEDCPYFGQVWSAARYLSRMVAGMDLQGRHVLELGCGLALPSLVAAAGGATCLALDIHPDVAWFVGRNARDNGVAEAVDFRREDWRRADVLQSFDLIMGSDILYENEHPADVVRFLNRHLSPGGTAIIVDPCRWHHLDFGKLIRDAGFLAEGIYDVDEEDGKPVKIHVLRIQRPFAEAKKAAEA